MVTASFLLHLRIFPSFRPPNQDSKLPADNLANYIRIPDALVLLKPNLEISYEPTDFMK